MSRKIFYSVMFFVSMLLTQSCLSHSGPYGGRNAFAIGEMRKNLAGKVFIVQDDSMRVAIAPSVEGRDSLLGARYYVEGICASDEKSLPGYDFTIEATGLFPVYVDTVVEVVSEEEYNKLGKDRYELWTNGVFVTGKYLNIFVDVKASGMTKHSYTLVHNQLDNNTIHGDTILLEFHHNANNDIEYANYQSLLSFDLSKIIAERPNKLVIGVLHYASEPYMSQQISYFTVK